MTHELHIGLVNNMPDAALEATERQFRALLDRAAPAGAVVRLTMFALSEVPRSEAGRLHIARYADIDELWTGHLDGLIVTGTEPRAANLMEEPYWASLTRLIEWASDRTHSTVWSCLAAHAAVLCLDGIPRCPLADKRFGVFTCRRVTDHPLTLGTPSDFPMPHSRWNDLPERALLGRGYRLLTRSEAGVDAFVKERHSLFVFLQGHPEYESETLMLEYRRDIRRFLAGERDTYPALPRDYFNLEAVRSLLAFQDQAMLDRREGLIAAFPGVQVTDTWRSASAALYRNWLAMLCARKLARVLVT